MSKLQRLISDRDKLNTAARELRETLTLFERPINKLLLDKNRKLESLDLSETIQIANLLINLVDDIQTDAI
jgi:hypothetical protein